MKISILLLIVAMTISSCATPQTFSPVVIGLIEGRRVCIIDNSKIRQGFLETLKQAMVDKGYEVQVLEPPSSLSACPVTATYTANWRWSQLEKTTYLDYAEVKIYNNAKLVGEAIYGPRAGGFFTGTRINSEEKVRELVKNLLPDRTGQ